jgi:hypothetical protein
MLTWINAGCDAGLGLPKYQAMHATSVLGQTEKNPWRANVFRVAPDSGLFSMQSALRICATTGSEALYSITSSARARSDGGTVSPMAFAVLRLIVSSSRVGCSTGRSPGLAPSKIRLTKCPARMANCRKEIP